MSLKFSAGASSTVPVRLKIRRIHASVIELFNGPFTLKIEPNHFYDCALSAPFVVHVPHSRVQGEKNGVDGR
jgi:hypothetical protein